jgi:hypothetical protein
MWGCVSVKPVEQRYNFTEPHDEVVTATWSAVEKLHWKVDSSPSDHLVLSETPRLRMLPLDVTVSNDSTLVVRSTLHDRLNIIEPAADLLIQATRQELNPADVSASATTLQRRSPTVTAVLDLLLPAAGDIYAHQGDVTYEAYIGQPWWETLYWRAGFDVIGATALVVGMEFNRSLNGTFKTFGWIAVGSGVFALATNRIGSLINDEIDLSYRNAVANSGLRFDLDSVARSTTTQMASAP